jgi:hypothetical protein
VKKKHDRKTFLEILSFVDVFSKFYGTGKPQNIFERVELYSARNHALCVSVAWQVAHSFVQRKIMQ